ncbi:MAG: oxidoreductase [Ornithinimicrobium sp.]
MRLLVLGGTAFLSYEVCRVAAEQGNDVTALSRGVSGTPPPGVTFVRGDRSDSGVFAEVGTSTWDAVVDISRQPGHVANAVRELRDRAGRYAFVSSISVYDFGADDAGADDVSVHEVSAPVDRDPGASAGGDHSTEDDTPLLPALEADRMVGPEDYGPAKVACERHALAGFGPDRAVVIRPGLIGGPGDTSGRSAYWPSRFAQAGLGDGDVLVPDTTDQPVQMIDVRDVAAFVVTLVVADTTPRSPVDVVGAPTTLGDALHAAQRAARSPAIPVSGVTGSEGRLVPASSAWLADHEVNPWAGPRSLPLWIGADVAAYPMMRRAGSRAAGLGLRRRDLQATFADELATLPPDYLSAGLRSGLTHAEHDELLAASSSTV